jgi:hypothetical protein
MGYFDRIKLYLQTDYRLDHKMNREGCAIRALIAYPEVIYRKRHEPLDIMEIVGEAFELNYIESDYNFSDPGGIVEISADRLGKDVKCYDIGSRKGSKTVYWPWVEASNNYEHHFTLSKWKTDGPTGTHFTLGDVNGKEIFDPYPVDVKRGLIYEVLMRYEEL